MGSINSDTRHFRFTNKKWSYETGLSALIIAFLWKPLGRPCVDAVKAALPLRALPYHPVVVTGIAAAVASCIVSAWLTLTLTTLAGLFVALWGLLEPASYRQHVARRLPSYLTGVKYRYRHRTKLTANGLLNDQDPTPTISHVQKTGCTTKVRIKMSYGDEIEWWRVRSARLAQTFNTLDCKINPYRRQKLNPFSKEMVTKPRWVVCEFLTKDPFTSHMGVEFINYHRADTLTPVAAVLRSGGNHHHNLAAHRLRVAMTRWGKSNAIRAMVYAQRHNIKDGLLELWGIDGKGGVEQSFLQHVFARVAYGDTKANPHAYHPAQFDQLLKDAVLVLKRRQRRMRGFVTEHIPTPDEPWLLIVIDEILVLTSKAIGPELRNSIAASIMLIQQQGIACGVSLDASTQLAQKERLDFRDGFTEFELGKVERGAVDMIFGSGWWERGARADEIPKDLKGVFYKKTDSTLMPEQIRYPNVPVADVSPSALGFEVEKSVLWPPPKRHVEAAPEDAQTDTPAAAPSIESQKHVKRDLGGFA